MYAEQVDAFGLSFEKPVPRHLVHKNSTDNVFLTDVKPLGEGWFFCGARVPAAHQFFNRDGITPSSDLLYYVEIGRQASIAISHSFFDASHDQVFVFDQSAIKLLAEGAFRSDRERERIAIEVKVTEQGRRKNGTINRLAADYAFYDDETQIVSARGAWSLQPTALFERLRRAATRPAPPVDCECGPQGRGKADSSGVITVPERIGDVPEFAARLIVDPGDPFFFDHPCDHVPGTLLIEACGQLALRAVATLAGCRPKDLLLYRSQLDFKQFVEYHTPVIMTARCNLPQRGKDNLLRQSVEIVISQEGVAVGNADLSIVLR